jgi:hypothetical protein
MPQAPASPPASAREPPVAAAASPAAVRESPAPPRVATAGANAGAEIAAAFRKLQPLELGILGGLALAAISTLLPWAGVSAFGFSETASAWNSDLGEGLRLADWLSAGFPLDAVVIVLLALAGAYIVIAPLMGWAPVSVPYAALGIGVLLTVLGVLNYLHIENETDQAFEDAGAAEGLGVSAGTEMGVYLLIVAGLAVAACALMIEQKKKKAAA